MATSALTTRRAALVGALASSAALAIPAVATAAKVDEISDKDRALLNYLKTAPVNSRIFYHASKLAVLLRDTRGGTWVVTDSRGVAQPGIEATPDVVMFTQHPSKMPAAYTPTFD